eukprot:TRINITY_DN9026_c0_g1_i1.p1 TRINITY_DN9026_c0_g1~~TRINITY_DN9026_c0_g1_i1.p1  ORF type:complete len:245 (-),score=58.88 TRINITY_DN9026_c0_g1_i1:317-1051(-)
MAEELDVESTNVGGIGSDEDKALRKDIASKEPAWEGAGLSPGTKVWRIEHFEVVPVEQDSYGQFHKGDSYIVLHTTMTDGGKLSHTIYFYLGEETSVDEQGTAAYKTVELDDFFHGEPKEVRVVMGQEPDDFKELFGSITYLEGGVDSGFKHVKPEGYAAKLFVVRRVKGKTTIVQSPLKKSIINENDCFVLDATNRIYVYAGKQASPFEKAAANQKAEHIESERAGHAQATQDIDEEFWAALQ